MPTDLTNVQINDILERYDLTDPELQRRILIKFVEDRANLAVALEESVKLQAHYAKLLNQYDGGERLAFENAQEWLDRMVELCKIPSGTKV